ncbi:MAG: hypothetical protein RLZZ69_3802 [Cyanobacteriota bacterium]|jgi:hypothetical protein
MTKERYQTLTNIAFWVFCITLPQISIFVDTIARDEVFSVGEILATICLVAGLSWSLMSLLSNRICERLLPTPTKYRLRIESTNIKSKYILESKKSNRSYWWVESVFEEIDKAIAEKQKLEDQEVNKIQIINL